MYSKKLTELLNNTKFYEEYKKNIGTDPKIKTEGEEYSQFELYSGFQLVANKDNWKDPIKTTISVKDFELCNKATMHFTGGELSQSSVAKDGIIEVEADGYYVSVGS